MKAILDDVRNVVYTTRLRGNTRWILMAAIKNPNCIIVVNSKKYANDLSNRYFRMLEDEPFYKRIIWKIFGRKHPKFMSIHDDLRGFKQPIIFDNSVFI